MLDQTVIFAFLLTLFAGGATAIGGLVAYFTRTTNKKLLAAGLGFSAGVLIYVSFVDILGKAYEAISVTQPENAALFTTFAFFAGVILIAVIDRAVPTLENPHEIHTVEEMDKPQKRQLYRLGILSGIAIAIHNFPEGLATFMAALSDPQIGIAIAVAIAIHNIPEGISISVPMFYATGSRKKALLWSSLSGLAEPIGAVLGFMFLMQFFSDTMMGLLFGLIAGIMVFIALDELLPAAQTYGYKHLSIYALVAGMAVMAISLLLLA